MPCVCYLTYTDTATPAPTPVSARLRLDRLLQRLSIEHALATGWIHAVVAAIAVLYSAGLECVLVSLTPNQLHVLTGA